MDHPSRRDHCIAAVSMASLRGHHSRGQSHCSLSPSRSHTHTHTLYLSLSFSGNLLCLLRGEVREREKVASAAWQRGNPGVPASHKKNVPLNPKQRLIIIDPRRWYVVGVETWVSPETRCDEVWLKMRRAVPDTVSVEEAGKSANQSPCKPFVAACGRANKRELHM